MATIRIPPVLRPSVGGEREVSVDGANVGELLNALAEAHPETRSQLFGDDGELNRYVNVYLNDEDVRVLDGLDTGVGERRRARDPAGDGRRFTARSRVRLSGLIGCRPRGEGPALPAPESLGGLAMNRHPWRAIAAALAAGALAPAVAVASPPVSWTNVPANAKATGASPANVLSPELSETAVAWGSLALDGATAAVPYYGYDGFTAPTVLTQAINEAHKTEPDKNTYLVLPDGQPGPDPNYDYGTHFLYQGHESGSPGVITRINLDADEAHRATLLATTPAAIDGSTWDPFAQRLLFTDGERQRGDLLGPARLSDHGDRHLGLRWAAAATRASRPTATATSGSSRTSAAGRATRARTPSSPTRSSTGSSLTTRAI